VSKSEHKTTVTVTNEAFAKFSEILSGMISSRLDTIQNSIDILSDELNADKEVWVVLIRPTSLDKNWDIHSIYVNKDLADYMVRKLREDNMNVSLAAKMERHDIRNKTE